MKAALGLIIIAMLAAGGLWFWHQQSLPETPTEEAGSGTSPATAAGAGGGGGAGPAGGPPGGQAAIPVRVTEVTPRRFETILDSLGTAQANESVTITSTVTGSVAAIEFRDGDQVTAGQVLVRLGSDEKLADQREARANLQEQRRELERLQGLVAERVVPVQQLDQQRTRVEEAEARLAAVEARLAERVIHAPFSGVLGLRRVSPGALVTPGTVLAELDDISVIKVDFTVPELFLGSVAPGLQVEVRSSAFPDRRYTGTVTAVTTRVDVATRSFTVRAEIDNLESQLRPGMLLNTRLFLNPNERLAVPEGAITVMGDQHFVFVVNDANRAERLNVKIGRRQPGFVEILEGLTEGQQVIYEGTLRVRPGISVRIVEAAA